MSKDYLDKWEERQKQNTEIIEQQQTKTKKMSNKIKATAFEVLQKKLTIEDTLEFREKHLQEILEAMEEYKNQNKDE